MCPGGSLEHSCVGLVCVVCARGGDWYGFVGLCARVAVCVVALFCPGNQVI